MHVHVWEISGFVKLNRKIPLCLEKTIKQQFGSFRRFSKDCKVYRRTISRACQREGGGFIKMSSLFKFTDYLGLKRGRVEKHIEFFRDSRVGAYGRTYELNFPFIITPKAIRLVYHIVGDVSVFKDSLRFYII